MRRQEWWQATRKARCPICRKAMRQDRLGGHIKARHTISGPRWAAAQKRHIDLMLAEMWDSMKP